MKGSDTQSMCHNTISIVIATYNGIKYIAEQLDSIRTQTLAPDEVIIADDVSTDGTYEFCADYIRQHGLEGWHVYRNESNLGPGANFKAAIARASGEYIFTCDQDDIWLPDKIQAMVSVMKERPEIKLLASNYIAFRDGKKIKVHLKNLERNDGAVVQYRLKNYWLSNQRPGCTYCFRRELADKFKVMDTGILHDAMLWKYAIVSDSLYLLNRQLIHFRRHEGNATVTFNSSATATTSSVQKRIDDTDSTIAFVQKFIDASDGLDITSENKKLLNDYIKFLRKRAKILTRRNLFAMAFFVMINFKYYPTTRNALSDIYAMIFLR